MQREKKNLDQIDSYMIFGVRIEKSNYDYFHFVCPNGARIENHIWNYYFNAFPGTEKEINLSKKESKIKQNPGLLLEEEIMFFSAPTSAPDERSRLNPFVYIGIPIMHVSYRLDQVVDHVPLDLVEFLIENKQKKITWYGSSEDLIHFFDQLFSQQLLNIKGYDEIFSIASHYFVDKDGKPVIVEKSVSAKMNLNGPKIPSGYERYMKSIEKLKSEL